MICSKQYVIKVDFQNWQSVIADFVGVSISWPFKYSLQVSAQNGNILGSSYPDEAWQSLQIRQVRQGFGLVVETASDGSISNIVPTQVLINNAQCMPVMATSCWCVMEPGPQTSQSVRFPLPRILYWTGGQRLPILCERSWSNISATAHQQEWKWMISLDMQCRLWCCLSSKTDEGKVDLFLPT